ncbi:MAG: type II toxin-antitoxin system Phd/YefM family antitoxin [Treponema sp.]
MLVETTKMVSITKLQKELTQAVRKVSEENEPVYILKNNNMAAVMIPFHQYEYLSMLGEIFEHLEIAKQITLRMRNYDESKSVDWDAIRED